MEGRIATSNHLDFSDSNSDSPSGWTQTNYPKKPHTHGRTQQEGPTCDVTLFCGRIMAYQYRFLSFLASLEMERALVHTSLV